MARVTPEEYDRAARSACAICRIVEGRPLFPGVRIVLDEIATTIRRGIMGQS